ncbi:signal transduction histidine kinase [Nonomuraea muscovyensis]|uniref:histidine kinase n=1 Tax=Nonomuraea muscovyensis TaxID=1124761 RepID=A0A7X0C0T4_9ACTN|nr:nitrate- and nitrite sensing domain-containing protein [Nonomuraea muscovyensis]MBB6346479.1 signal transduction histidine kinase [Nonomuraea muscovyensis]
MASGRSIRFKIATLLVIPLVSLVALWGFAASSTFGDAFNLLRAQTIWTGVINYADGLVGNLQGERLASAERLGGAVRDPAPLAAARAKTDRVRTKLTESAGMESVQSAMTAEMNDRLADAFEAIDRLPDIRRQVDSGKMTAADLVTEYSAISDAVHILYSSFTISTDVELARQAQGLIAADEVREMMSRGNALIVASDGKLSMKDVHLLSRFEGARLHLFPVAMANLDAQTRAPFEKIAASSRYATMQRALESYMSGEPVNMQMWRELADPVMKDYTEAVWRTGDTLLGRIEPAGVTIIVRAAVAGALGLIAVVFSIIISIRVGRRVALDLGALRRSALDLAEIRLPGVVERLRRGDRVDVEAEAPPIKVADKTTSEVADLAAAFDSVQRTAVDAAVEQARLREGVSEALRNLARRSQSLLQRQLRLLDDMQRETEEPEALERLFRLDHLTTRMRRHAEGLVLLSGGSAGRRWRGVIPVEDVLNGAAAQVEEYTRVRVYPMPEYGFAGTAVADLMHLFAELIENATTFSSPGNEVSVRGELVGRGFAVEVEDRGLGMPPEMRQVVNERLASPPEFDPSQTEQLGFAVVGMLAARHGISVTVKPSPYGGTSAIVLVPPTLVEMLPMPLDMPELESVSVSVLRNEIPGIHDQTTGANGTGTNGANGTGTNGTNGANGSGGAEQPTGPGGLPRRVRTSKRTTAQQQDTGLPRRQRQANLPPQLRQPPVAAPPDERSPEETRALLSSLQSGWQRGRQDSDQDGGSRS